MKFHEFRSWWDMQKSSLAKLGIRSRDQAYTKQLESMKKKRFSSLKISTVESQAEWYERGRPYYKVYPCIVEALCKLNLDFNCECPKVPEGTICIRFADGHEPESEDGNKIASLLVHAVYGKDMETDEDKKKLLVQVTLKNDPDLNYHFYFDTNRPPTTIQQRLDDFKAINKEIMVISIRIALTVLMLADDPEIITPDVLADNQNRYDKETDEGWKRGAESRAKNRGVFGWSIGKNIEVAPHIRRPYWAIRHTGPGKKIPKIVPVKGCKVNWDKLTTIPTGYILPNGTEVEDGRIAS